jgi:hypothetical protein
MLGEHFCSVVYSDLEEGIAGGVQPRTAAFDSAIVSFNSAISIGGAAGSGADDWVMVAKAGIAQAHLGRGDLVAAAAAAAEVPTDFVYSAIYNISADANIIWQETHGRAEIGVTNTAAFVWGNADEDPDGIEDPRMPYTVCGVFDPAANDGAGGNVPTGDCLGSGSGAHQGADGLTAHIRQDKYPLEGSDIPYVHGTEMRLIQAEKALVVDNDLGAFIGFINEVRDFHGLPNYPTPSAAGEVEFPNVLMSVGIADASVDAWSILDKERYATLWMESRRFFDLDRWDHPFLLGGETGVIIGSPAASPRVSCMPIPEIECQLNPELSASDCT